MHASRVGSAILDGFPRERQSRRCQEAQPFRAFLYLKIAPAAALAEDNRPPQSPMTVMAAPILL